MGKLSDRVAIVTGASKGIGAAIARHLAAEGAAVVVNYASSKDAAERVVVDITHRGGRAVAVRADVARAANVERLFASTKEVFGRLDILVNNAGVLGKFNEELVEAGVMEAGEGFHPSKRGKRVRFAGGKRTVVDGPFAETRELVAGFWVWKVKSIDEALAWVERCPDPMPGEEAELEVRPIFEAEDFGEALTPELRAQEDRLRAEIERQSRR